MLTSIKKSFIYILLIFIFLCLLFFYFSDSIDEVAKSGVKADLKNIKEATLQFKKDRGSFPQNIVQLKPYFNIIPSDPWGDAYIYTVGDGWVELKCCKSKEVQVERFGSE
ncbi:hypothetical protein [Microbulbifer sp. 2205BS26-8]|uniref:hypothetical protein n=1 Tax=Microbulbifer sp. 2205BS26-8 TaxID=3064386 RepID=UPI00273D3D21|nr:hypothetical protein [Microbulbifer sp. 2205BS26-8]MDP5210240.1 hypothetical protein [Microbulbifer sp. 2205BS26-8]